MCLQGGETDTLPLPLHQAASAEVGQSRFVVESSPFRGGRGSCADQGRSDSGHEEHLASLRS